KKGMGKNDTPQLAGQYTQYLWRQVDRFLKGERIHDEDEPDEELLEDFSKEELRDIFAWLSVQDD
ncbi:MAG: cytochrome C, partial [Gammaproteobacteria bacterium]